MKEYTNIHSEFFYSQIPWLGKIPNNWELHRLDKLFKIRKELPLESDQRVTAYLDGRVTLRSNVKGQKIKGVVKEAGWQRIHPGDFAISGMNAHIGGMGISDSLGKCSPIYLVLIPNKGFNVNFVSRVVRYTAQSGALKFIVNTIRYNSADFKQDDLKKIWVWLPPLEEQNAIVRFLEYTDRRIKRYIRTKQKLIKLLEEEKQAIIHQAITRGLNPDVPMKPSGVEWLGDIPEQWKVKKIKNLKKPIANSFVDGPFGSNLKSEHYVDNGDVYVIESGFITTGNFIYKKFKTITNNHFETIKRSECISGDIIIAKIGANYGIAGILPPLDKKSVVSGNSLKLTVNEKLAINKFVHLALLTAKHLGALEIMVNTNAQPALTLVGLNNLKLPNPCISEQKDILLFIHNKTSKINKLIEVNQKEISHLHEYHTRMIADVVTGKLDVREAAAQLPEELEEVEVEAEEEEQEAVEEELDEEMEL